VTPSWQGKDKGEFGDAILSGGCQGWEPRAKSGLTNQFVEGGFGLQGLECKLMAFWAVEASSGRVTEAD
jgi:hypothetical protein